MEIYGSPCSIKTYDANLLTVSDIPRVLILNQPVEFSTDASKADNGQVKVNINNGRVPNQVKQLEKSKFLFKFIPTSKDLHNISITLNEHQIPGK